MLAACYSRSAASAKRCFSIRLRTLCSLKAALRWRLSNLKLPRLPHPHLRERDVQIGEFDADAEVALGQRRVAESLDRLAVDEKLQRRTARQNAEQVLPLFADVAVQRPIRKTRVLAVHQFANRELT